MTTPGNSHDYSSGRYQQFTVDDQVIEVTISDKLEPRISDAAKLFLRESLHSGEISVIRDNQNRLWVRVGPIDPDLSLVQTITAQCKIFYFQVEEKICKSEHFPHGNACVKCHYKVEE